MGKMFGAVLAVLLFGLLLLTRARSCLVAILVLAVLLGLESWQEGKLLRSSWFCGLVTLAPLLAVAVYGPFLNSGLAGLFSFLTGAGKGLGSRAWIWNYGLAHFHDHLLLGDYGGISGGTGMSQMHNTGLDVLASYGLPVGICYHLILYRAMARIAEGAEGRFRRRALAAFYCVMIQGVFEAGFVSGGAGLYLLSCGFLLLAGREEKP